MKKGILLVLVSLVAGTIYAQSSIDFHKTKWESVLQKAAKENKLVFVDAYTTWCGPCKQMTKEVFSKKDAANFYNKKFINYKIDMEKGEGPALAKKYKVAQYPTLLFVASDGTLIHRAAGYHNVEQLVELGNNALDPSKQLATQERKFAAGDRNPEFLKNYTALRAASYDGSHVPIAEAYLKTQDDWNTKDVRDFIFNYVGGSDSGMFDHLTKHRKDYIQQFGEDKVRDQINKIVLGQIAQGSTKDKVMPLKEVKSLYKKAYPEKAKQLYSEYKMSHYRSLGDRKGFAKAALKHYKKFPSDDPMELNDIAWTFNTVITQKKYLKKAVKLVQKSVKLEPAFYNHDTLAALYYKLGEKEKALTAATKAIELAKKEGFSPDAYGETTKLLESIKQLK